MKDIIILEAKAKQHLVNMQAEWNSFCITVEAIKDSGAWRDKANSWNAYCNQVFGVSSSRIRQHLSAYALSERLEELTGIPLLGERQGRYLREFADTDERLVEIHTLATHAALELGEQISRRHIKAVADTLHEASVTNGNVTVQGEQIPVATSPDTLSLSVVESARESSARQKEYRTQGLQDAPVSVLRFGDKAYAVLQLPNDYPIELLQDFIAKVPKPQRLERVS